MGLTLFGLAANAGAQTFTFTINSTTSSYKETTTGSSPVVGNLIGNYSATNLTGTRTKPGVVGSWGATENDPIAFTGIATASSTATTPVTGSFVLVLDTTHLTVKVEKYTSTFFGTTPASVILGLSPKIGAFQTKNPTFIYPAITSTVPLGPLAVKNLKVVQGTTPGVGVLKLLAPHVYGFSVLFPSVVSSTVSVGTHSTVVTTPAFFGLSGAVTITGATASFAETVTTTNQTSLLKLPTTLPTFPVSLPTFSTAKANVLVTATVTSGQLKASTSLVVKAAGK